MNTREKAITARLLFVLIISCLTLLLCGLVTFLDTPASYAVPNTPADAAPSASADFPLEPSPMPEAAYTPVRLTFAGSCTAGSMLGSDSYGTFNHTLFTMGAGYFLQNLRPIFDADTLTVTACDVVLSDREPLSPTDRGTFAWYRAPASAAEIFTEGGVDALSLHCYHPWDYGADGYNDTIAALEAAGLVWGDQGKAIYNEWAGISVALYCRYVDDEADADAVRAWLETATARGDDFVAVYIATPATVSYAPDESRKATFRSFIDAGADLVVGTDTEKLQPWEDYGDGKIVYSLGSLLDGRTKYPEASTALVEAELRVLDEELVGVEYTLVPCMTYDEDHPWQPYVMEDAEVLVDFMNGLRGTPEME